MTIHIYSLFALLLFSSSCSSQTKNSDDPIGVEVEAATPVNAKPATGENPVILNDINFEEPEILKAVLKSNKLINADGTTPIRYIDKIVVNRIKLKSTSDLRHFTNLKVLILSRADVAAIDLSNNKKLTEIQLPSNKLTEIDLSNQTELIGLNLAENDFKTIDLSANKQIEQLVLSSNQLHSINLNGLENLITLNVAGNELKALTLEKNTNLKHLLAHANKIEKISLAANKSLSEVNLSANKLTTIDLTNHEFLNEILLGKNLLFQILLPNTDVGTIILSNNKIEEIIIPKKLTFNTFWLRDNPLSEKTIKYLERYKTINK